MSDDEKQMVKRLKPELVASEDEAIEAWPVSLSRARPQAGWISRLRTKQVQEFQRLLEAETGLAGAAVEHRRALHRLAQLDDILEIDDIRLAQAKEAALREGELEAGGDAIRAKEQDLALAALDYKIKNIGRVVGGSGEDGESQAARSLKRRHLERLSYMRARDELIEEIIKGRPEEELSEDERTQIENIRDDVDQMIGDL